MENVTKVALNGASLYLHMLFNLLSLHV
jgi:hypothetical protein